MALRGLASVALLGLAVVAVAVVAERWVADMAGCVKVVLERAFDREFGREFVDTEEDMAAEAEAGNSRVGAVGAAAAEMELPEGWPARPRRLEPRCQRGP